MLKSLMAKLGVLLKPLWKRAAKRILASQSAELRLKLKGMIDDDSDASIVRINKVFDGWQDGIIKAVRGLSFMPPSIADAITGGIQREGDVLQRKIVDSIIDKGPAAIDFAFEGIEAKLNALIDAA